MSSISDLGVRKLFPASTWVFKYNSVRESGSSGMQKKGLKHDTDAWLDEGAQMHEKLRELWCQLIVKPNAQSTVSSSPPGINARWFFGLL